MRLKQLLYTGLLIGASTILTAQPLDRPEIVAHRGASWVAPENTLASVRLAWDLDADAAEVDVYLTADDRVIVMHDGTLKRTAGLDMPVASVDWATMRDLEVGSWKGERWAGEPIPLLEQLVKSTPEGKRLFVEVKCGPEIVPHLERIFSESGKSASQIAVISFNYEVCVETKRALPDHKVYYLSGFKKDEATGEFKPTFEDLISKTLEGGLDGIDVSFRGPLTEENIAKVHNAGLDILVYTVDELTDGQRMTDLGVNGITTDRPDFLMDELFQETRSEKSNSSAGSRP